MKAAICGFLNTGKTTLFNALCGTSIQTTPIGMPDADIHTGAMNVADRRLDKLSEMFNPQKTTPVRIDVEDLPGMEWNEEGDDRIQRALLNADVLVNVVRAFEDSNSPYSREVDPVKDAKDFLELLILKDLVLVEKRLERIEEQKKKGKRVDPLDEEMLKIMQKTLQDEKALSSVELDKRFEQTLRKYQFLSLKPLVFVINLSEEQWESEREAAVNKLRDNLSYNAAIVPLCAKIESEIAQLDPEDREAFMEELHIEESATSALSRAIYESMSLITFFTVGEDEVRGWAIREGTNARQAAGKIHSDMEKGFIRAEVVPYEDLIELGSLRAARDAGKLRLEGKDYIVKDGDIMHVRFNV